MDSCEIFEVFGAFPQSDGTRNRFCPCSDTNVALLKSKMVSFSKISKSCVNVTQTTLRSGKNWLRYSSFSVISQVKWPNLRAWQIFEHFKTVKIPTGMHENVSKKYKDFNFRNGMTGKGCVCQKCSNHIYKKLRFSCGTCRKNLLNIAILPVKAPRLITKTEDHILSQFLVDPFPALWSTWNMWWKWSSQKVELETCKRHLPFLKISSPSYSLKTLIYPSKTVDVDHILSMTRYLNDQRRTVTTNK